MITVATEPVAGTPLAGWQGLEVSGPRIDVVHRSDCNHPATEKVLTVVSSSFDLDIGAGTPRSPQLVTRLSVPPGCVEQVRLIAADMHTLLNGQSIPTKVPSGPQTGVKIVPDDAAPQNSRPFPIVAHNTTTILVHYDPNAKLVINKGQGVLQKPVLEADEVPKDQLPFTPDEVVVTFKQGTSPSDVDSAVAAQGAALRTYADHLMVTVKLPDPKNLEDALSYYNGLSSVLVALPNNVMRPQAAPNPFPANMTPNDLGFVAHQFGQVKAPAAWAVTTGYSTGPGSGVRPPVIAVIDNGFNVSHTDLAENAWINQGELPPGIIDTDGDGLITFIDLNAAANDGRCNKALHPPTDRCDPMDLLLDSKFANCKDDDGDGWKDDLFGWDFEFDKGDCSGAKPTVRTTSDAPDHGSDVAAIAAGVGNNGVAGTGMAWHAQIMFLKTDALKGGNRDQFVMALKFALDHHADVIQSSLGFALVPQGFLLDCRHEIPLPDDKLFKGISGVLTEFADIHKHGDALMVFSKLNCGGLLDDDRNIYIYPGSVSATRTTKVGDKQILQTADPEVLAVTSVNAGGMLSDFASSGQASTQIGAPGEHFPLISSDDMDPTGFTPPCNNDTCSGTSFAAPMVFGAAVLCLSANLAAYRNPNNQMDAAGVALLRSDILDRAALNPQLSGVENNRILDASASVNAALARAAR